MSEKTDNINRAENSWAPGRPGSLDQVKLVDSSTGDRVSAPRNRGYHVIQDYTERRHFEEDGTFTVEYKYAINYDRWKAIAAGLYLEFLAGLIYAFPVYSVKLKLLLGVDQTPFNLVSTLGTIGGNFSILAGVCLDAKGPTRTSTYGAWISALGFLGIFYLTTRPAFEGGYIVCAIFYFIAYQGLTWMDMSTVTAQVTNFPAQKGLAVGLVKTQFGLAASAIVILSVGFFDLGSTLQTVTPCIGESYMINETITKQKTAAGPIGGLPLLFFFSMLCLFVGTIASHFLKFTPPTFNNGELGSGGMQKMIINYGFVLLVMAYCLVVSLVNIEWRKTDSVPQGANLIFAIVQVVLYVFPFFLLLRTKRIKGETTGPARPSMYKNSDVEDNIVKVDSIPDTKIVGATRTSIHNYTFFEALCTLDFWCLFFTFFGGTGAAYMTINNLGQINTALGGSAVDRQVAVIFVGLFNCLGRIVIGNIQDRSGRYGITRPVLCAFAIMLMGVGQLVLAEANNPTDLLVGIAFTAFAFGSTWCLIGPATSDVVGPKAFGKIFSSVSMAAMLSTTLFNSGIAGPFYDAMYEEKFNNKAQTCCGSQCFNKAHIIAAIVSFCVSAAPLTLAWRTRGYYKKLYSSPTV
jgi:MFS family permease